MKRQEKLRSGQRGISLIGLLFVGGVLAFGGVIAAQVFPTFMEYLAIKKAATKAASGATPIEVRSIFDKAAQIDNIKSISGKDLEVGNEGGQVVVSFAYDREIHLAGPAYLLMKYEGRAGVRQY